MKAILINSLVSGGAEKVVLTILKKCKESDEVWELFCLEKKQEHNLPEDIPVSLLSPFHSFTKSFYLGYGLLLCALRLRKLCKKNDILFVQSHLISSNMVNIVSKLLGSTHHVQIVNHTRMNFDHQSWLKRWLKRFLLTRFYLMADSIVSISQVMKKELDEYLGKREYSKNTVRYNPHNPNEIKLLAKKEVKDFRFKSHKFYIISAGRLIKEKRLDDLIKAFATIKSNFNQAELIILGKGTQESSHKQLVNTLNLDSSVHFLGFKKNPYTYLRKSQVCVVSSETEGFPNIIIESLICGTAVISSDCISGPREILHPESDIFSCVKDRIEIGAYGILYPVRSVLFLEKALTYIMENPLIRKNYERLGSQRGDCFNVDKILHRYLSYDPELTKGDDS